VSKLNAKNLSQETLDKLWDRTKTQHTLLVSDYSSLEIGIPGDLCQRLFGDGQLIQAYRDQLPAPLGLDVDLHSNNARNVFGTWLKWTVPPKMKVKGQEVEPKYAGQNVNQIPVNEFKEHPFGKRLRDMIKAIWYGLAYGKRGFGFQTLKGVDGKQIGLKMADKMVDALLDAVPGMRLWDEWVRDYVRDNHGIYSLGGRWCDLERECSTGDDWDFARAVRRALNFPMQATGAEIIGDAMVRLSRCPMWRDTGFRVCLQVHDELVARGPEVNVKEAQRILVGHMRSATANGTKLLFQVECSSSYALNYAECK
jgi:DNA polymerase I-like protein with 3'-5' exonuclease and polymerase domains